MMVAAVVVVDASADCSRVRGTRLLPQLSEYVVADWSDRTELLLYDSDNLLWKSSVPSGVDQGTLLIDHCRPQGQPTLAGESNRPSLRSEQRMFVLHTSDDGHCISSSRESHKLRTPKSDWAFHNRHNECCQARNVVPDDMRVGNVHLRLAEVFPVRSQLC